MFTTLLATRCAIVSLLSIRCMTVPLHLVTPAMRTIHRDRYRYHGFPVLSPFLLCWHSTTASSFWPPPGTGGRTPGEVQLASQLFARPRVALLFSAYLGLGPCST